jgi:hypothetical protein
MNTILTNYRTQSLKMGSPKSTSFRHGNKSFWKSDYSRGDKIVVAVTTAKCVLASLMLLAKFRGKSIKPRAFYNYLKTMPIKFTEVVTMGVGTCLGGLLGGYLIDKDPLNRKAKRREAVMQFGNITIPIGTVKLTDLALNALKVGKKSVKDKVTRATASLGAILAGIYIANFAMNKISNHIFKESSNERGIKGTDLFPHIDDVLSSGEYILEGNKFIRSVGRIVPFALMVPGNEIGNKKAQ